MILSYPSLGKSLLGLLFICQDFGECLPQNAHSSTRQRLSINKGWQFHRFPTSPDNLIYDLRPDRNSTSQDILKAWILPSGNDFIVDPANHHVRPAGDPGSNISFVQPSFDDAGWETVNLPHDWAINGPFYTETSPPVGGGMGRLPVQGVGWYRRKLSKSSEDEGKQIYLDIDGAMSYAMVWLNGDLVGGWPYPYNSFRLDLTPYLKAGDDNQLAIRLDNPVQSARWYPGAGLYRSVWLTKVNPVHVGQWGTFVSTKSVSHSSAIVDVVVQIENKAAKAQAASVVTDIYTLDSKTGQAVRKVAECTRSTVSIDAGQKETVNSTVEVQNPNLWGPLTSKQSPNMYIAITRVYLGNNLADEYSTKFGIRSVIMDPNKGVLVNNELVRIRGTNLHHDLGAIGAAFNVRAAIRYLEVLRDVGSNAIRMSHNPPAPELLDIADEMGFLIIDEVFDSWYHNKTANDFHLIFEDWHEPDLRAMIRRDRNHPSIIAWSVGNEVGEQYDDVAGAAVAKMLVDIVKEENPERPSTASMNYAKPNMPFPREFDVLSLNYQGEGIRDGPAYSHLLTGIHTPPLYSAFHGNFSDKLIWSSESASALSTRGTYIFPVTSENSAPINNTSGGNSTSHYVSSYELYSADFGASADKVFLAQDANPYVAGEFVWTGWDYIGEPTPYYTSRSSYCGFVDLAGFPKDRYYLYLARWRPELKFAHILPHWNWVGQREGLVTPVHVFSSADSAELWVNGVSQGRLTNSASTYRFRWDKVVYEPGEVRVVTYKNGAVWSEETIRTTGSAARLQLTSDRPAVTADGEDVLYLTLSVLDGNGNVVPTADNAVTFSIQGPGEIIATNNGDPTDLVAFPSKVRKAFSGLASIVVKATGRGEIVVAATAEGLASGSVKVYAN